MGSLRARLLVVASCVLLVFMVLCGVGLETAVRNAAMQVQRDRMRQMNLALMGAAEPSANNLLTISVTSLPDVRLRIPDSGLVALIFNDRGSVIYRSPSFDGAVPAIQLPDVGVWNFQTIDSDFILSYTARWPDDNSKGKRPEGSASRRRFTVTVIEDSGPYWREVHTFRRTLWLGLGGSATALLIVQLLVLRWGLSPMRRLAGELREIESGEKARIDSKYPAELTPLAEGLNAMIQSERSQQTRYRNALGDLAHSLKTPLAVLRGTIESQAVSPQLREQLEDPLRRFQDITDYQLKRASAAGRRTLSEPIIPREIVDKTITALIKVYSGKLIHFVNDVPPKLRMRADIGDLYEVFGNLLDNACKWCTGVVRIRILIENRQVKIEVDDDGPGFPKNAEKLLQRGVRADSLTPGQGIGLATVADVVALNDGTIQLSQSDLGGGRVQVLWPI